MPLTASFSQWTYLLQCRHTAPYNVGTEATYTYTTVNSLTIVNIGAIRLGVTHEDAGDPW